MKILKIILITILGVFVTIILLVLWGIHSWKSYNPNRETKRMYYEHKSIWFENKIDLSGYFIKINFAYDQADSLFCSVSKMDSIICFNKIDSIMLNCYPSDKTNILLPVLRDDSIPFPKSFNIKIYTQDKTRLMKELDYNSFTKYAIPSGITNREDFLLANEWILVIDSVLLELK